MPSTLLNAVALLFLSNVVWGETFAEMKAAKRQFESEGRTEQARAKYVGKLAELLEHEIAEHITSRGHNREIDKLDAELKKHPAPRTADTRQLTALRVGKWQSPRHSCIYRANGTWRMAPESGTNHGQWRISGNKYEETCLAFEPRRSWDSTAYTIIALNRSSFVFTDGKVVFYEGRSE
jgi:hypothetical protein